MTDLTEAVARAIYNDKRGGPVVSFDQLSVGAREYWVGRANAAIAAMRAQLVPVAFLYSNKRHHEIFAQPNQANMDPRYWTETALCAMPGDE